MQSIYWGKDSVMASPLGSSKLAMNIWLHPISGNFGPVTIDKANLVSCCRYSANFLYACAAPDPTQVLPNPVTPTCSSPDQVCFSPFLMLLFILVLCLPSPCPRLHFTSLRFASLRFTSQAESNEGESPAKTYKQNRMLHCNGSKSRSQAA